MLDDPSRCGHLARQFGCFRKEGLDLFLRDMRTAHTFLKSIRVSKPTFPGYLDDLVMLSNRLVAIALRAQLWHLFTWDTGYIWPDHPAQEIRKNLLAEYVERATNDIVWYEKLWNEENLESEWAVCKRNMQEAVNAVRRIFAAL